MQKHEAVETTDQYKCRGLVLLPSVSQPLHPPVFAIVA